MEKYLDDNFKFSPTSFCDLVWWFCQYSILICITLMQLEMDLKKRIRKSSTSQKKKSHKILHLCILLPYNQHIPSSKSKSTTYCTAYKNVHIFQAHCKLTFVTETLSLRNEKKRKRHTLGYDLYM